MGVIAVSQELRATTMHIAANEQTQALPVTEEPYINEDPRSERLLPSAPYSPMLENCSSTKHQFPMPAL
jgi:hypothetical protein